MMEAAVPRVSVSAPWFPANGGAAEELLLLPGVVDRALRVEELEHLLGDVLSTLSRLDSKRGRLQDQIAAASRGRRGGAGAGATTTGWRRRGRHYHGTAPAVAPGGAGAPAAEEAPPYTRKGAGAVRRRLRAAAGGVKKERERLEAVWGELEAALVDARERLALPQHQPGTA